MSILRDLARGQECKVRIPGECNHNPETTVLAHLGGGGTAMKHLDIFGAHSCSACHDAIDGRGGIRIEKKYVHYYFNEGVQRTQQWLYDNGHISWNGDAVKRKDAQAMEALGRWLKRHSERLI